MFDYYLVLLLIWLISAYFLAINGKDTEEGFGNIFLVSTFLSPIIGGILLIASRNKKDIELKNNLLKELKDLNASQTKTVEILEKLKDILSD